MVFSVFVVLLLCLLTLLYWYISKRYSYWSSRGVTGPRPWFPFGNMMHFMQKQPSEAETEWSKQYGDVYGAYRGLLPLLTIADPELVKQVAIKHFPIFAGRMRMNTYHELWDKNVFMIQDPEEWKRIRSIISPTFTSGKLKQMTPLMTASIDKLGKYFDNILKQSNESVWFDAKEIISGATIDIIATTVFACEINTNDPVSRDKQFVTNAHRLFTTNVWKAMVGVVMPRWFNDLVGIYHFFHDDCFDYFHQVTKSIVDSRIQNQSSRNDFVQMLLNARVDKAKLDSMDFDKLAASMDAQDDKDSGHGDDRLSKEEIIAQCIIFLLAGFETTSNTITFMLYEMAMNPEIQENLVDVINEALEGLDPKSSEYYDQVMRGIPYLDAVIKETLRKYPPLGRVTRLAAQDTEVGGIPITAGTEVHFSVYSIHHNPLYYPEPERWDPERFMPENKAGLNQDAYLPFGIGPRNCVGMRFAYQEIKFFFVQILPRYRFSSNANTPKVIVFKKPSGALSPVCSTISVSKR